VTDRARQRLGFVRDHVSQRDIALPLLMADLIALTDRLETNDRAHGIKTPSQHIGKGLFGFFGSSECPGQDDEQQGHRDRNSPTGQRALATEERPTKSSMTPTMGLRE